MPIKKISSELNKRLQTEIKRLKPAKLTPKAIDWKQGVRHDLPWIPYSFIPLYKQPVFDQLKEPQKVCYNQYYALQMTEQFIWVENCLTILPIRTLLKKKNTNTQIKDILFSMEMDEVFHHDTLYQLVQKAKPELYPTNGIYNFLKPPFLLKFLIQLISIFPQNLYSWIFILSVFEEFALTLNRHYSKANEEIDPLFKKVHTLHAIDEARHCHFDTLIANWLTDRESKIKKCINRWMLKACFTSYYAEWSLDLPIKALLKDFPELSNKFDDLMKGVLASRGRDSRQQIFDQEVSPLTYKNRLEHEILDHALIAIGAKHLSKS